MEATDGAAGMAGTWAPMDGGAPAASSHRAGLASTVRTIWLAMYGATNQRCPDLIDQRPAWAALQSAVSAAFNSDR